MSARFSVSFTLRFKNEKSVPFFKVSLFFSLCISSTDAISLFLQNKI